MVRVAAEEHTAPIAAPAISAPARRFAVFAVAAYVAVWALVGLDLWRSYNEVMADAERNTTRLSRFLSAETAQTLGTLGSMISSDPAASGTADPLRRRIGRTLGIRQIIYADAHGGVRNDPGISNVAAADFFTVQVASDAGLYIGHPLRDVASGQWVIPLSRRLVSPSGDFAGVAAIFLDAEHLRASYQMADLGPEGIVTLVLADGTVLVRQPHVPELIGSSIAGRRLFSDELAAAPAGSFRDRSRIDGVERMLSYVRIPGAPLVLVVGTAMAPARAELFRELRTDVLAALIIGAVLLLSALVLARRQIAGEAILRAREAHVRRMTDNLPGAIFSQVLHADGRIEYPYMSSGSESILGYSPAALAADPALLSGTVHSGDQEAFQATLRRSAESMEPWSIEMRAVGRDGAVKWIHMLSHPRQGLGGEIIWDGFLLDITERKRAEAALEAIRLELQKKNHVLDIAFDNMSQGLMVHDVDHSLLAFNPRCEELFNLPRGFLRPGLSYQEIFACSAALGNYTAGETAKLWAERLRIIESGERHALLQHMTDGRVIESIYQPLARGGSVITFTDVTEAVRREAELGAKSTFLQVTLEHMGDGISVYDSNRRLRAWNDRYLTLLGLPQELAKVGTPWGEIVRYMFAQGEFGVGDVDEFMALRKQELDGPPQQHWERRRPDGTVIEFQRNRMPDGGYVTVYRDITALKQTEAALVAAKEEAEKANRSKGEFLANMSHELRTPLNAIIGFAEILRDQMFGPLGSERYVDYSRHIHASGTHLLDLINDVLDLSKIEAGRFELDEARIELPSLLRDCFDMVQARARTGGVAMALELPPTLPLVWADDRALKQVVLNLLSNGVKFTPPGGQVSLSIGCGKEGIDIVVRDSGIGITTDALARVVHPFGQADASISRRFGGTGLGLPISKHLVELHGGTLVIESRVGAGTIVTVRLPASRILSPVRRLEMTQQ